MQTGLKMQTVVFAILFCAISMGGMLFFARNKAIEIDNVAQDQVVNGIGFADIMQEAAGSLRFRQTEETTEYLCIPLENGVKAEEVTIENHYMEKQVWVYIKDTTAEFYAKEAIFGNLEGITEGIYEHAGGTTLIKFTLAEVYECKSVLEEGYLYIDFVLPGEVYDRIVVIDAGFGGTDNGVTANGLIEKDINLDIIKRVKELLDNSGIKVYYTRTTDVDIAPEDRIALANDTDADMFAIRLLAPACVLHHLHIRNEALLSALCGLPERAAVLRAERMALLDSRNAYGIHPLEKQVQSQFAPFIRKKRQEQVPEKAMPERPAANLVLPGLPERPEKKPLPLWVLAVSAAATAMLASSSAVGFGITAQSAKIMMPSVP